MLNPQKPFDVVEVIGCESSRVGASGIREPCIGRIASKRGNHLISNVCFVVVPGDSSISVNSWHDRHGIEVDAKAHLDDCVARFMNSNARRSFA